MIPPKKITIKIQSHNSSDDNDGDDTENQTATGLEKKTERLTCMSSVKMCVKPPDWEEEDTFVIRNIQGKPRVYFCSNTQVHFNKAEMLSANLKTPSGFCPLCSLQDVMRNYCVLQKHLWLLETSSNSCQHMSASSFGRFHCIWKRNGLKEMVVGDYGNVRPLSSDWPVKIRPTQGWPLRVRPT